MVNSRITIRFKPIARGRHALCSGRSPLRVYAKVAPVTLRACPFRANALRPCSQLKRLLYGPKEIGKNMKFKIISYRYVLELG